MIILFFSNAFLIAVLLTPISKPADVKLEYCLISPVLMFCISTDTPSLKIAIFDNFARVSRGRLFPFLIKDNGAPRADGLQRVHKALGAPSIDPAPRPRRGRGAGFC